MSSLKRRSENARNPKLRSMQNKKAKTCTMKQHSKKKKKRRTRSTKESNNEEQA